MAAVPAKDAANSITENKNLRQRLLWLNASFEAIKCIQERIALLVILSVIDVGKWDTLQKFAVQTATWQAILCKRIHALP